MELGNRTPTSGWIKGEKYQKHYNSSYRGGFFMIDAAIMYLKDKDEWSYPIGRITFNNSEKEFWGTISLPHTKKNCCFIKGESLEGIMLRLNVALHEYGFLVESPL
jgi:hypothetical protein